MNPYETGDLEPQKPRKPSARAEWGLIVFILVWLVLFLSLFRYGIE